jgi:hypothetical protein
MISRIHAAVAVTLALGAGPALAHDVANMDHTHAFQQLDYGKYRQGHSVNNQYGSITIYSPRTYTGYQDAPAVRVARPKPITRPPGAAQAEKRSEQDPAQDYGRDSKADYGD